MKCMRCGKESKWELCRECKEVKHRAGALISQNKKKLKNLLDKNILEVENYNKFIQYYNKDIERITGISSGNARKRLRDYKSGKITKEKLFAPKSK